MGVKQHLFICTFRISNWFVTGIKFWSDLDGKIVFTHYRILSCISFFKPRKPKHSQMGQSGCQTTPFHLYIQNIKLVCDWNQVLVRPGWENRVTHYRILSCISFFKPRRPKYSQMGQSGYQTTPLHLYIQSIKLVCDWNQVLVRPEWENHVYTLPNIKLH